MNLLNSTPPGQHIHNLGYLDYQEILKLIPKDWQNEIKQNTALPEQNTIKVKENAKRRTLLRQSARNFTVLYTKEKCCNAIGINMKIGNSKIIRRSLRKNNGNNFSLVFTRIRNRKKLLTFSINSYSYHNPP